MNISTKVKFPRVMRPMAVLRELVNVCEDSKMYITAVRNKSMSEWRLTVDAAIEYLAARDQ